MTKQKINATFRIGVVGSSVVGVTSLLRRHLKGTYSENFKKKPDESKSEDVIINGKKITIEYGIIRNDVSAAATCEGFLLVYDITDESSFAFVVDMAAKIRANRAKKMSAFCAILVGAKCDLQHLRQVPFFRAQQFAIQQGFLVSEVSAKIGHNISACFTSIVQNSYAAHKANSKGKATKLEIESMAFVRSDKKKGKDSDSEEESQPTAAAALPPKPVAPPTAGLASLAPMASLPPSAVHAIRPPVSLPTPRPASSASPPVADSSSPQQESTTTSASSVDAQAPTAGAGTEALVTSTSTEPPATTAVTEAPSGTLVPTSAPVDAMSGLFAYSYMGGEKSSDVPTNAPSAVAQTATTADSSPTSLSSSTEAPPSASIATTSEPAVVPYSPNAPAPAPAPLAASATATSLPTAAPLPVRGPLPSLGAPPAMMVMTPAGPQFVPAPGFVPYYGGGAPMFRGPPPPGQPMFMPMAPAPMRMAPGQPMMPGMLLAPTPGSVPPAGAAPGGYAQLRPAPSSPQLVPSSVSSSSSAPVAFSPAPMNSVAPSPSPAVTIPGPTLLPSASATPAPTSDGASAIAQGSNEVEKTPEPEEKKKKKFTIFGKKKDSKKEVTSAENPVAAPAAQASSSLYPEVNVPTGPSSSSLYPSMPAPSVSPVGSSAASLPATPNGFPSSSFTPSAGYPPATQSTFGYPPAAQSSPFSNPAYSPAMATSSASVNPVGSTSALPSSTSAAGLPQASSSMASGYPPMAAMQTTTEANIGASSPVETSPAFNERPISVEQKSPDVNVAQPSSSSPATDLKLADYFRAGLTRQQAEKLLFSTKANSFVVRESSVDGHFALTKYDHDAGKYGHFLIEILPESAGYKLKNADPADDDVVFPTIPVRYTKTADSKRLLSQANFNFLLVDYEEVNFVPSESCSQVLSINWHIVA